MKKSIVSKLLGLALLLIIWQTGSLLIGKATLVLPGPLAVIKESSGSKSIMKSLVCGKQWLFAQSLLTHYDDA